jgi:hypothetical protein
VENLSDIFSNESFKYAFKDEYKALNDKFNALDYRVYGVSTEAQLLNFIADTTVEKIFLNTNITLTGKVTIARALKIYGGGFRLTQANKDATDYIGIDITADNVEINNVQFYISGNSDGNTIYSINARGDSRIIDCTFVMANAGSSGSVSVYFEGNSHVIVGNTCSNGMAFTDGAVITGIMNNTFAATKGIGLGSCVVNGIAYTVASPSKVASITAFLKANNNVTTGASTIVVEGYFE